MGIQTCVDSDLGRMDKVSRDSTPSSKRVAQLGKVGPKAVKPEATPPVVKRASTPRPGSVVVNGKDMKGATFTQEGIKTLLSDAAKLGTDKRRLEKAYKTIAPPNLTIVNR